MKFQVIEFFILAQAKHKLINISTQFQIKKIEAIYRIVLHELSKFPITTARQLV